MLCSTMANVTPSFGIQLANPAFEVPKHPRVHPARRLVQKDNFRVDMNAIAVSSSFF